MESTETTDRADPAEVLASSCAAAVAAGEQLAGASAASARDWAIHIRAQLTLEAGKYTLDKAKDDWAVSKARGPGDLTAFAAAAESAETTDGGCDGAAELPDGDAAAAVRDCAGRLEALARVGSTGTTVNTQWAAHLEMMKTKAKADSGAYHKRWLGMVRDAQPALKAHTAAMKGLDDAPRCTL